MRTKRIWLFWIVMYFFLMGGSLFGAESGKVEGLVFWETQGGATVAATGADVYLYQDKDFRMLFEMTLALMDLNVYRWENDFKNDSERKKKYGTLQAFNYDFIDKKGILLKSRKTAVDTTGKFLFDDVPPGKYYIIIRQSGYVSLGSAMKLWVISDEVQSKKTTTITAKIFQSLDYDEGIALFDKLVDEFSEWWKKQYPVEFPQTEKN